MRVLVIEDERELARTVAAAIGEAGLAADVALDGGTGLELGLAHEYDAVVLDLLLPVRHGLEVLDGLKRDKPGMPVLVLTALDRVDEIVAGLDRGADDYLGKPFALAELLARLRALLRRGRVPSALVRLADIEVDVPARTVRRAGRLLSLTPREFALLLLFVHNPGRVLTRADIGERLVDRNFESTSNLIDVSVHGLRVKLGKPDPICTVRGAGYRFDGGPRG